MGFTTPCFIRKNTPELQKKLEELGYEPSRVIFDNKKLCLATAVNNEYAKYTNITNEMFDSTIPNETWNCAGRIDCGTNEELFLAIAALRDDIDTCQWFTDGKEWFQCQYLKVGMHYQDKPEILFEKWHKATVNELMGNILKAINRVSMTE